ncbi:hypothetical protein [Aquisphaera giovannonii]|nr:hypothetical protein [Aquisphaera giovannonii]
MAINPDGCPAGLPARYPGGPIEPPVATGLYLTIMRAELAHLAFHADQWLTVAHEFNRPQLMAWAVRETTTGLSRYFEAWNFSLDDISHRRWPTLSQVRIRLERLVRRIDFNGKGELTDPEFADLVSTPETISECNAILNIMPDLRFYASRPATRDRDTRFHSDSPIPAPSDAPKRERRLKPGEAAMKIIAALDSLAQAGEWNVAEAAIIHRAGVKRSTYYKCLNRDDAVQKAMERYHDRRLGSGPVRSRDI